MARALCLVEATAPGKGVALVDDDVNYEALAAFRYHVRAFFAFSEDALQSAKLMPAQYQAMLAIKARETRGERPTASSLASELFIRLNTAVELIDRLEAAGMIVRRRSQIDRRKVELSLTDFGLSTLKPLASIHFDHHCANMTALSDAIRLMVEAPQ